MSSIALSSSSKPKVNKPLPLYKINVVNDYQSKLFIKSGLVYSKQCCVLSVTSTDKKVMPIIGRSRFLSNLKSFNTYFKEKKELKRFQKIGSQLKALTRMNMKLELCLMEPKIKMIPFIYVRKSMYLRKMQIDFSWCVWPYVSSAIPSRQPILYTRHLEELSICCLGEFRPANTYLSFLPLLTQGKRNTNIKGLTIKLDDCHILEDKGLYGIIHLLQKVPKLQRLSLGLKDCPRVSDDTLYLLLTMFNNFSNLRKFSFEQGSSGTQRQENSLLPNLSPSLSQMVWLQELDLACYKSIQLTDADINSLSLVLNCHYLASLRLKLIEQRLMTENGFNVLGFFISKMAGLSKLELILAKCRNFNDNTVKGLSKGFGTLSYLRNLYLYLEDLSLSDAGLIILCQNIFQHKDLQELTFKCLKCKWILGKSIIAFGQFLHGLNRPQKISLQFDNEAMIKESLSSICNGLAVFPYLTTLELNFSNLNNITDQGLREVALALKSQLALTELTLNFSRCSAITDDGLTSLSSAIPKLIYLQTLTLNFEMCMRITDYGHEKLVGSVSLLTNLRILSLIFTYCSTCIGSNLANIKSPLLKLKKLNTIKISYSKSFKFYQEIKELYEALSTLPCLENDIIK